MSATRSELAEEHRAVALGLLGRETGAGIASANAGPRRTLFGFIWSVSARQQLLTVALAMTVALLELAPVELQRRIIDGAIVAGSLSTLFTLGAIYLAVILCHQLVKHALRVYRNALAEDVLRSGRERIYHLTDDTGTCRRSQEDEGTRVAVLGPEVEAIAKFAGSAFAEPAVQAGTILGLGVYMILTEPMLALFTLPFLVPQLMIVPWLQRRINDLSSARISSRRSLNDTVMGSDEERFVTLSWDLRCLGVNIAWWKSLARIAVNGLNALAPLVVLGYGGYLVIEGQTSIGVVVAFISAFQRLADPARDLLDYYREASLTGRRYALVRDWLHDPAADEAAGKK